MLARYRRRRVYFASDRKEQRVQLYVATANGSRLGRLTESRGRDTEPAGSPDGQQLAYASNRDGNDEIYVLRFR